MTRKVSAEVDVVHQQTQNQRDGSSHIGATANDISSVVNDAASGVFDIFHVIVNAKDMSSVGTYGASGVFDIFHAIDKAAADIWNHFWKDSKADGIGSNLSRK